MIAKEYSQDPRDVATWETEWLVAAFTVMEATAAAQNERRILDERRANARARTGR
jgi:hypothetical protein